MFNAEQMLGKVLSGALGSGMSLGRHGLGSSLTSQLASGAGLMTVIGLGVGAYEILKGQNSTTTAAPPIPPVPPIPGQVPVVPAPAWNPPPALVPPPADLKP